MAAMESAQVPMDFDWKDFGWRPVSPPNPGVDVRVREPLQPGDPTDLWLGAASLEDIVGASLVTYDEHIDPFQAEPIVPKAIYVRYDAVDPVTQALNSVVIPAQLTLDAYADPWMFWQPYEEELEEEEEQADEEMEDRRKLRSSIKGDPILLRAKPAPPPEPYLAPYRYEKACMEALRSPNTTLSPEALRRRRQIPPLGQLQGAGADSPAVAEALGDGLEDEKGQRSARAPSRRAALGSPVERAYGSRERPAPEEEGDSERRFFSRCVEAAGTMSSFQKASGRDKYGHSRLRELDRILARRAQAVGGASGRSPEDPPLGLGRAGREDQRSLAARELEARLATHIQRVPHFRRGRLASAEDTAASRGDGASEAGESSAAGAEDADVAQSGLRQSARKKVPRPVSPADGANGTSQLPATGLYDALLAVAPDAEAKAPRPLSARRTRRDAGGRQLEQSPGATVRLRDLDPHLCASGTAPTQHLHSNWPDGLKRKVARHFYGMTHAQILMEEHRERMRDHGRRTGAKEGGAEPAAEGGGEPAGEQKPAPSPRKRPQAMSARNPRELMAPGGPANIAHGLEIRIPNSDQPSVRVVVSRHTQRVRRNEESAGRQTMLLDKLSAEPKRLSRKY